MLTYLNDLDPDLQDALKTQLRNLWTHTSTAIEGNTLTLGETAFVLEEGLTILGKPLKDHEEVVGHARAIDLIYDLLQNGTLLGEQELFNLHKAVQTQVVFDVYKPVGGWKLEPNSTVGVVDGKQIVFEYALPFEVPQLMQQWFDLFREAMAVTSAGDKEQALEAYAQLHISFVRIHPFFDGNGRMARLVANLPVLKAGLPPIIIPREQRKAYIDALAACHYQVGQMRLGAELLPEKEALRPFIDFCRLAWEDSVVLVDEIHKKQQAREQRT